jgi:hypothetical protein
MGLAFLIALSLRNGGFSYRPSDDDPTTLEPKLALQRLPGL